MLDRISANSLTSRMIRMALNLVFWVRVQVLQEGRPCRACHRQLPQEATQMTAQENQAEVARI